MAGVMQQPVLACECKSCEVAVACDSLDTRGYFKRSAWPHCWPAACSRGSSSSVVQLLSFLARLVTLHTCCGVHGCATARLLPHRCSLVSPSHLGHSSLVFMHWVLDWLALQHASYIRCNAKHTVHAPVSCMMAISGGQPGPCPRSDTSLPAVSVPPETRSLILANICGIFNLIVAWCVANEAKPC